MIRQNYRSHIATLLLSAAFALTLTAPAMAQYQPAGPGYGTPVVVQPLTAEELKSLQFMREEEKLARDLYKALFDKWKLVAFRNISASEDAHFTALGKLLARYGAVDPAQSSAGVYADPGLNALYNQLLAKGMQSALDALEVGILVEKKDIADLESTLSTTTKFDVKRVYNNLTNGSYNHLDAFETVCALTVPVI